VGATLSATIPGKKGRDRVHRRSLGSFGVNVDWPLLWDDTTRVAVAALLGGALGFEREWKGHWAGLRTHMMVSIGSAIFVIAGLAVPGQHPEDAATRVIQGVASGIGFLGAGTILKLDQKQEIKGLTTAGSIWLAAALGIAAGTAEYALAIAAVIVSLFVLAVLGPLEKVFERRQAQHRKERDIADRQKTERKLDIEEKSGE
jgi:putative Mg2+ transporter-C (MgtC) family protein